jgi:hypothetical protein
MTEFVGSNLRFGDLILMEEFDYGGKIWRSYLLVPQEHLEDLFNTPHAISPIEAYHRNESFWNRISELTRDLYKDYLKTQTIPPTSESRRQWFQWKDLARLEAAYRAFTANSNQPLRLSVVARDPATA